MSKLIKAIVKHTALLHNGVRYDVGAEIELDKQQADHLAYYLILPEAETAQTQAETTQVEAVQAQAAAVANESDAQAENSELEKSEPVEPAKTTRSKAK